jgi:hypothetical protein
MNRTRLAPVVALGLVLGLSLSACGDDDAPQQEAPPVTNEFGVETFEPSDDPWADVETTEPGAS